MFDWTKEKKDELVEIAKASKSRAEACREFAKKYGLTIKAVTSKLYALIYDRPELDKLIPKGEPRQFPKGWTKDAENELIEIAKASKSRTEACKAFVKRHPEVTFSQAYKRLIRLAKNDPALDKILPKGDGIFKRTSRPVPPPVPIEKALTDIFSAKPLDERLTEKDIQRAADMAKVSYHTALSTWGGMNSKGKTHKTIFTFTIKENPEVTQLPKSTRVQADHNGTTVRLEAAGRQTQKLLLDLRPGDVVEATGVLYKLGHEHKFRVYDLKTVKAVPRAAENPAFEEAARRAVADMLAEEGWRVPGDIDNDVKKTARMTGLTEKQVEQALYRVMDSPEYRSWKARMSRLEKEKERLEARVRELEMAHCPSLDADIVSLEHIRGLYELVAEQEKAVRAARKVSLSLMEMLSRRRPTKRVQLSLAAIAEKLAEQPQIH